MKSKPVTEQLKKKLDRTNNHGNISFLLKLEPKYG